MGAIGVHASSFQDTKRTLFKSWGGCLGVRYRTLSGTPTRRSRLLVETGFWGGGLQGGVGPFSTVLPASPRA